MPEPAPDLMAALQASLERAQFARRRDAPTPVDMAAVEILIAHGRTRIEGCHCGWGMDGTKLAQSHPLHVWRELQRVVLPDHDAALLAEVAEAIVTAFLETPLVDVPWSAREVVIDLVRNTARAHANPPEET